MKITVVYGQNHKGSTYRIARMLAEKLDGDISEIFLPRDFGKFCVGCAKCILHDAKDCPHAESLQPITQKLDEADVIILASPVYVYHVTGSMKALLDHYGWRWMVHRPEGSMFRKQAVCIATAAGAGMKSTCKDMADSLWYWGVGRVYQYGTAIYAINYQHMSEKKKREIENKTTALARKIKARKDTAVTENQGIFYHDAHCARQEGQPRRRCGVLETAGMDGKQPSVEGLTYAGTTTKNFIRRGRLFAPGSGKADCKRCRHRQWRTGTGGRPRRFGYRYHLCQRQTHRWT